MISFTQQGDWARVSGTRTAPERFRTFLARSVKASLRRFTEGRWEVHRLAVPDVVQVARRWGGGADVSQLPKEWLPPEPEATDPWEVLWLRRGAPREVVLAAYRAMAKKTHPDAGGSGDAFRRVNQAYESIMRELGE